MCTSDGPNIILSAWRSISSGSRDVLARANTIRCDVCLRVIRCWNRRVWLDDGRCAHLQCFHGQFLLKALVEEIRRSQLASNEVLPKPSGGQTEGMPTDRTQLDEREWLSMAAHPERTRSSCISTGTRISGKVDFGEMARIEGEVEGEITGDNIEIAPSAVVMARITANSLKISGQVNGEIVARERIEVLPTARLRCTITTPTLVVTEGAQFDGDCKMPHEPTSSPQSHETKETELSFFITQAQRAELRERGYSDDDIALMIPAVAHRILGV
jgi:cytoskeletal protein CcmA (bactofilin family)